MATLIRDSRTGRLYTEREVERMRSELEADTGLPLATMQPRGVVANWLLRRRAAQPFTFQRRVARSTGTTVAVIDARREPWEGNGPWVTVCETHGGVCEHPSRRYALDFAAHPEDWCPTCQENADAAHGTP